MSFLWAVYLSLAFHFLFYLFIQVFPNTYEPPQIRKDLTEVEIINKPFPKEEQQIVRKAEAPEKIKTREDRLARFLSADDQTVSMETRARNIGLTQNRNPNSPQRPHRPDFDKPKDKPANMDKDFSGYEPIRMPRPNEYVEEGPSTVGEVLPNEIPVGSFTALNTDRFQFYSFYSRVEELVRFRWESQVRGAIDRFDPRYVLSYLGKKNWITHVEFLITPEGHLHTSRVMRQSGVKVFDESAIFAFQDARFFPNPPKELIESDGYIHLRYAFNVYFEPSAFASQ